MIFVMNNIFNIFAVVQSRFIIDACNKARTILIFILFFFFFKFPRMQ